MPVTIKPKKMMVSKDATKGGGGMDIATRRDALADKFSKALKSAMKADPAGRLSTQDIERALRMGRERAMGERPKKAGGGKTMKKKKMMAKGGTAGGKKPMMMGGGKTKKMMMGGGKTKKMMMGGGKAKKMMRGGGKTKKYMSRGGKAR
jgi:hypothetical protein